MSQVDSRFAGVENINLTPDSEDWNYENRQDFTTAWHTLREQSYSRYLGLCFPRFLLRTPYGKASSPIESFDFEEMPHDQHLNYLWGNSAYLVALLLGQSYASYGWRFKPGIERQIDRMPTFYYEDEYGEKVLKPAAEILLTESDAQKLMGLGLLPVWSVADSDHIRVGPFRSACIDASLIQGHWQPT